MMIYKTTAMFLVLFTEYKINRNTDTLSFVFNEEKHLHLISCNVASVTFKMAE